MGGKQRKGRVAGLAIWGLALGYFSFYVPYSALTKALAMGLLPGMERPISGFELLPATAIATALTIPVAITLLGWWKHAGRREILGLNVPFPNRWTWLSGIKFRHDHRHYDPGLYLQRDLHRLRAAADARRRVDHGADR